MPTARVFISHSTKEPAAAEVRDRVARALTDGGHRVLLDKDVLELGERWRQTLNRWIGACDAAVVLLTEAALRSPFVAYEMSLLSYRAEFDPEFLLIPVFVAPVDETRVRASLLEPAQITERQALNGALTKELSTDQVIERVLRRLSELPDHDAPEERRVRHLVNLLEGVPGDVVEEQIERLGYPLAPWLPGLSAQRKLAEALLGADLKEAVQAIRSLRTHLPPAPAGYGPEATIEEMLLLVASAWVDLRSIREIPAAAGGSQGLCVSASRHLTAKMYVICASTERPLDSWTVARVDGVVGEDSDGDLARQVRDSLCHELKLGSVDELPATLAEFRTFDEPVFVSLPAAGVDSEAMDRLRNPFAGVTFFLLAGQAVPALECLEEAGVVLLRPPLDPQFESRFEESYETSSRYLIRRSTGGPR